MPLLEQLPLTEATRQWAVWGTTARVVVTDPGVADEAEALVRDRLEAVEDACSRFREDSELAVAQRRLARRPGQPVVVSPMLAQLIRAGLRAAERTDGDVDPTLADDLAALGYDRDYAEIELRTTTAKVRTTLTHRIRHRWTDIRLDGPPASARLSMPPRVHLDLGASAKACAADLCAQFIHERLGTTVLVALGGDIATAGRGRDWQILVQDGRLEPPSRVRMTDGAMATSSTLSRRWRDGTRAVHHILDPSTGLPAAPVWRTVSVAAPSCAEANALSTAAIVRGAAAVSRLRATGHAARLVGTDGTVIKLGGWP
jgi:thiamine biosynthesis lipoprotein